MLKVPEFPIYMFVCGRAFIYAHPGTGSVCTLYPPQATMTRAAFVVTALMTFVLLAQADEAQPGHWGGKPGGSSGPRFSTLSGVNYMPVRVA